MPKLADVFEELGLSQYLDSFVEQGFDTWETCLDIRESDLYVIFGFDNRMRQSTNESFSDVLQVKLGHRRVSRITTFCSVYN